MVDETTSEQLAEIEGQAESTPATEYTPPEGWRVLAVGEKLQLGDMTVRSDGYCYSTERVGYYVGLNQRYIRRIGPEPQPQPEPVQVCEGRWRTRNGLVRDVTAMPTNHEDFTTEFPWWDGKEETWTKHGHLLSSGECPGDLIEYLGPLEQKPQPEPQDDQIEELRSEVANVQNLLGESRQRVTQLEELVSSLRTINDAQEKTVRLAGQENTDLQHRLNVVSAELVEQFETVRKLRIELDAAQQVPQAVNDRFEEGWDAGTARAVETIAEWTEPLRTCGSERLAWMVMQNLPHIMRTLTGLTPED